MAETDGEALHKRLLVIDGLIFFSDGDAGELKAGNVTAANLTISGTAAGFEEAMADILRWQALTTAADSPWHPVLAAADIERARASGRVGLIMGWQNTKPLGDQLERIALFHQLGLRVVQLTYNYAELFGDGCLESRNAGLSRLGVDAVAEMNRVGIAIDLSHCGEQTCLDAARHSKKPVFLTHANAKTVHNRPRNKSDTAMRAVADTGGIVGASLHGFMNWSGNPAEPPSLEGFVRHVRHMVDLVGIDHVGFGTDLPSVRDPSATQSILDMSAARFAGATGDFVAAFGNTLAKRYPDALNSPRFMARQTAALLKAGFGESQVEKIMGRNLVRVLGEVWGSA
jgi:membrane dipeptidase